MEGYLKGTHRKLLKIREKYTLMKTAKEIAPVFAWAAATIGFSLITFWGYAENRLSKMGIFYFLRFSLCAGPSHCSSRSRLKRDPVKL